MVFAWISDLGFTLHSQFVFASPPPPRLRGEEEDEALPRLVGSAVGDTDARAVAEGVRLDRCGFAWDMMGALRNFGRAWGTRGVVRGPGRYMEACDARGAVLFSGGSDCRVLARLADLHLPPEQPLDLINVAFGEKAAEAERKELEQGILRARDIVAAKDEQLRAATAEAERAEQAPAAAGGGPMGPSGVCPGPGAETSFSRAASSGAPGARSGGLGAANRRTPIYVFIDPSID